MNPTTTDRPAARATLAAIAILAACDASTDGDAVPSATADCPTTGEEWEVAKLYIEHNATDEDTGVHGFFGGDAWSVMCVWDPAGTEMLLTDPLENFDRLTMSDMFFESREPPDDEYPVSQAMADFPAGDYRVSGIDFEGTPRVGTATLTHAVPSEPAITRPALASEDETADAPIVATTGLVVEWDAVTTTIAGEAVEITGYELIITDEEAEDPHGWARPVYDVHVPGDQTSLAVADGWLRDDTLYELEVLAIEASGNQTISVGFFRTE